MLVRFYLTEDKLVISSKNNKEQCLSFWLYDSFKDQSFIKSTDNPLKHFFFHLIIDGKLFEI